MAAPDLHLEEIIREANFGDLTDEFIGGFALGLKLLRDGFERIPAEQIDKAWLHEVIEAHLAELKRLRDEVDA